MLIFFCTILDGNAVSWYVNQTESMFSERRHSMNFDATISFPGLGIGEIDPPRYFTIFGKDIYLYGIIICVGMLLALFYAMKRCRQFGFSQDTLIDAFLWGAPCGIIGARLFYVLFYIDPATGANPYFQEPLKMLYIWEGGLAIYGGVIGAIVGVFIYTRIKKKKMLPIVDLVCIGFLLGQAIGRWGNFFNREAYGSAVSETYFLRMQLAGQILVHPTFLYESVWNLIGFILLHFASKKRKYDGQITLMYLAWYGLGRCVIEGLRSDSLYIGSTGIRVSQLIAGLSFVAAIVLLAYFRFRAKPDPAKMLVNSPDSEVAEDDEDDTSDDNKAKDPETIADTQESDNEENV